MILIMKTSFCVNEFNEKRKEEEMMSLFKRKCSLGGNQLILSLYYSLL